MRLLITPGGKVAGETRVPGDKSIAHRWLILAATAGGRSELRELPASLDVLATARCLAQISPKARPSLEAWASNTGTTAEAHRFTWSESEERAENSSVSVEAEGRHGLDVAAAALDCMNSGTTMRLVAGVVAAAPFETALTGDASLLARPMDRIAAPLQEMGAEVQTSGGRPPIIIRGGKLHGIRHSLAVPSAQVKGCVLLAGLAADGQTTVEEPAPVRDHTERALLALGAPVRRLGNAVTVSAFQHEGFEGRMPGDISSAAFLVAGAALTGSELLIRDVGLNPTRTHYLAVMERMGVRIDQTVREERLGEPVGELRVRPNAGLRSTTVEAAELPLVIDEVPVLAAIAAHANGDSWFIDAAELRFKESDRLTGLAEGIRGLGGHAAVEGDDLVFAGGGLEGGSADPLGDHRLAMAFSVAALAARAECAVEGIDSAEVSYPGFVPTLLRLGARISP